MFQVILRSSLAVAALLFFMDSPRFFGWKGLRSSAQVGLLAKDGKLYVVTKNTMQQVQAPELFSR